MKALTYLFGATVGVIFVAFGMTIYTAVQESRAQAQAVPRVIATPAIAQ